MTSWEQAGSCHAPLEVATPSAGGEPTVPHHSLQPGATQAYLVLSCCHRGGDRWGVCFSPFHTVQRDGGWLAGPSRHLTPHSNKDTWDAKVRCSFDLRFPYRKGRWDEHSRSFGRETDSLSSALPKVKL